MMMMLPILALIDSLPPLLPSLRSSIRLLFSGIVVFRKRGIRSEGEENLSGHTVDALSAQSLQLQLKHHLTLSPLFCPCRSRTLRGLDACIGETGTIVSLFLLTDFAQLCSHLCPFIRTMERRKQACKDLGTISCPRRCRSRSHHHCGGEESAVDWKVECLPSITCTVSV